MTDPKIRYDITANAEGAPQVEQLAAELEKLDAAVDPRLAAKAQDIAAQLRVIGQQQAAIDRFRELRGASDTARDALTQAQQAAQSFAREIAAAGTPTRAQAGQMEKLRDAVRQAKTEHAASVQAVQQHRQAMAAAGVDTQHLATAQVQLNTRSAQLRQSAAAVGDAYRQQAAAAAASAETQVRSHRQIAGGVDSISKQLNLLRNVASAALGGKLFTGLTRDIADTADAYNTLAARIRMVAGEGAAFDEAMAGVFDIARRTGAEIDATGNLFLRLSEAVQKLGGGQREALALTEMVNQAVALSGGSAQASEAAVTQLIQALQGGVLRGQEFNSVMQQSPRLAKALADGLGVTTGELRKMAEAGQLTAEVVIGALQGQMQAVQSEFERLPPTVGRALQAISVSWTQYIGQVDQAGGVTATAARALQLLAEHLDTLAGLLLAAGKAAAAYTAVRLAQEFIAQASAMKAAAAAAQGHAAATGLLATVSRGAATAVGLLGAAMRALPLFALLGVVTNLKEIGTWLGTTAARWMGYGKAIDEAEQAARREKIAAEESAKARAAAAQATAKAQEAALGLTAASRKLIAEFDETIKKGEGTAAAMDKLAKALQLDNLDGIKAAGTALDALAVKGQLTAAQVAETWQKALAGKDLLAFETSARAAFDGAVHGAEKLAGVMRATLAEALRRTGIDLRELHTGISAVATSAINDFDLLLRGVDNLKRGGVDAAKALEASFGRALAAANTEQAVRLLIKGWEDLGKQGVLTGERLRKPLEQARDKLDELTVGVNTAREGLRSLGVQSDAALRQVADKARQAFEAVRNGGGSVREVAAAFEAYARAAIAANGGVASSTLQAQAAALGLRDEIDRLSGGADRARAALERMRSETQAGIEAAERNTRAVERSGTASVAAAKAALEAAKVKGDETEIARAALQVKEAEIALAAEIARARQAEAAVIEIALASMERELAARGLSAAQIERETASLRAQARARREAADAAAENARRLRDERDAVDEAAKALQAFGSVTLQARTEFAKVSDVAAERFEALRRQIAATLIGTRDFWSDLTQAQAQVNGELAVANASFERIMATLQDGVPVTQHFLAAADAALGRMSILGEQRLAPLRSALADARARTQALADSARSTVASLRDELDELNANYDAIEQRRNASRRAELETQLAVAQAARDQGSVAELQQALRLLDEISARRLADARARTEEARAERERTAADAAARAPQAPPQTVPPVVVMPPAPAGVPAGAVAGAALQAPATAAAPRGVRVVFEVAGGLAAASGFFDDEREVERLLDVLRRAGARVTKFN